MSAGFNGRRALVTGAASGIGEACARAFAERGATVVVADLDGAGAERVAHDIGGEPWQVDLTDTAALATLALDADILVNNAGIQVVSPIEQFDPAAFHRILDPHARGAVPPDPRSPAAHVRARVSAAS